jgi:hypothetical protein
VSQQTLTTAPNASRTTTCMTEHALHRARQGPSPTLVLSSVKLAILFVPLASMVQTAHHAWTITFYSTTNAIQAAQLVLYSTTCTMDTAQHVNLNVWTA